MGGSDGVVVGDTYGLWFAVYGGMVVSTLSLFRLQSLPAKHVK